MHIASYNVRRVLCACSFTRFRLSRFTSSVSTCTYVSKRESPCTDDALNPTASKMRVFSVISPPVQSERARSATSVDEAIKASCCSYSHADNVLCEKNEEMKPEARVSLLWHSRPYVVQGRCYYSWIDSEGCSDGGTSSRVVRLQYVKVGLFRKLLNYGMPLGYPHTVALGYRRFFFLHMMQGSAQFFAQSIGTQTLLGGFFIESSPQMWIVKDLAPAIFAALCANRFASYELCPKLWFAVAAVLAQLCSVMDFLIPCICPPSAYLLAASFVAVVKQNALLMHYISRASLLQHFSIRGNLGETQKKVSSFGSVNFTVASALGILFASYFTSFYVQLAAMLVSTAVSVGLSYAAVHHVHFNALNTASTTLLASEFTKSGYRFVPSPEEVDHVLGPLGRGGRREGSGAFFAKHFLINPALSELGISGSSIEKALSDAVLLASPALSFTIGVWRHYPSDNRRRLVLLIHKGCQAEHILCAYLMCTEALLRAEQAPTRDFAAVVRACFTEIRPGFATALADREATCFKTRVKELRTRLGNVDERSRAKRWRMFVDVRRTVLARPWGSDVVDTEESIRTMWIDRTALFWLALELADWDVRVPIADQIAMRISAADVHKKD